MHTLAPWARVAAASATTAADDAAAMCRLCRGRVRTVVWPVLPAGPPHAPTRRGGRLASGESGGTGGVARRWQRWQWADGSGSNGGDSDGDVGWRGRREFGDMTPAPDGAPTPHQRHRLMTGNLATSIHYGEISNQRPLQNGNPEIRPCNTCLRARESSAQNMDQQQHVYESKHDVMCSASPRGIANTRLSHLS